MVCLVEVRLDNHLFEAGEGILAFLAGSSMISLSFSSTKGSLVLEVFATHLVIFVAPVFLSSLVLLVALAETPDVESILL